MITLGFRHYWKLFWGKTKVIPDFSLNCFSLARLTSHIFWHYTVFVSLGNCPHPRSEEVHRLLSSPEFKKPLSLLGVARVFGEAVKLWFESMVYVLEIEWPLQPSLSEDEVALHPPLPPNVHEHRMGHLDFRLSLPPDQIYEVLLLQVKAVLQTSFCCHDLQFNQRQSFHFGFAQACHFSRRRKMEWILQEDHQPTNLAPAVLRWSKRNHSVSCRSRLLALHEC